MKGKSLLLVTLSLLLVLGLGGGVGGLWAKEPVPPGRPMAQGVTTEFTYQGRLSDASGPVTDTCDFKFTLYFPLVGPVGEIERAGVEVSEGLFTVQLDFGSDAFNGELRSLEIRVKCTGDADYATLSPHQPLTATPYALYALKAQDLSCAWCVNSLEIEDGTITFADIGQNGCSVGQIIKWDGTAWVCASDNHTTYSAGTGVTLVGTTFSADTTYLQRRVTGTCAAGSSIRVINADGTVTCETDGAIAYQRIVVVSPVGTATENGTALLNALAGISGASATNPYLLKIEPGVYDLGTSALVMKEWVDIEGSGELVTTIKRSGSSSGGTGTVVGASNAELRFLTVQNTGGNGYAIAIYNSNVSPRLTHVTANASGGSTGYGVCNYSSSPTMNSVTVSASGGSTSCGVYNNSSSPTMTNVTVSASDSEGSTDNYGICNYGSGTAKIDNSRIISSGNTIYNVGSFTTRVGASRLDGGQVTGGGTDVKCAGVYDENYTFAASTCPS